ncbi:MAG: flagellar brake protein [Solirubrobacteraceae bacterium]
MSSHRLSWIADRRRSSDVPAQLKTPEGQTLSVNISLRGDEMLLVLIASSDAQADRQREDVVLETVTSRGLVRLHGNLERVAQELVRFHPFGDPELIQRREFVRVKAAQRAKIDDLAGLVFDTHAINLSGGGMLITGKEPPFPVDSVVQFRLDLGPKQTPVDGMAKVVRTAEDDRIGVVFTEISDVDRDRLIRFIFDRQRRALAITRGDSI